MMRFRRLLVPHDLSAQADRALKVAAELAGPTGELLVLHAVMPVMPTADFAAAMLYVPVDELMLDADRHLRAVVTRVVGRRGPKTRILVVVGDPYASINAHTRGMDAVVMSTLGRTGLSHLVMGSVAEKTVRHSPIPVLTLRPQAAARATRVRPRVVRRRSAKVPRR